MSSQRINDGAIVERPREIRRHPLLDRIYRRHDALIGDCLADGDGRTLELALGTHAHPEAAVGIDAFADNTHDVDGIAAATADARHLPFRDDSFRNVIGRRFLHHVPAADRGRIIEEAARVLAPGGRLVLLEGTPGWYRRAAKGLAFRLGVLGEDTDEYGHLTAHEVGEVVSGNGFELVASRSLGSPLMPFSASRSRWAEATMRLYERTQWVRWWTLVVAEPTR